MITITPYIDKFSNKERLIYSINNENPEKFTEDSITTSEMCPYCNETNVFKLFKPKYDFETDRYFIAIYDSICPECNEEFEILDLIDKISSEI